MTEAEKKAAALLVQICLNKGYFISVNDGEEWVVKGSRDLDEVIGALGTTDGDLLRLDDSELHLESRASKGWFELIYGNAPDELVSDHRANDICGEISEEWQSQLAKEGLTNDSSPA